MQHTQQTCVAGGGEIVSTCNDDYLRVYSVGSSSAELKAAVKHNNNTGRYIYEALITSTVRRPTCSSLSSVALLHAQLWQSVTRVVKL